MIPLVVSDDDVHKILTMDRCIFLMESVFRAYAGGHVIQPLRSAMPLANQIGLLAMMPGSLTNERVMGAKVISVFPDNFKVGEPSHQGVILLFDSIRGRLLAVIDAETITGMRTAAVSAVATNALAREEAEELAILGAGVQGRYHLQALSRVRSLKKALVWDISDQRSSDFVEKESPRYEFPVEAAANVEDAVGNADIICTVTSAREPILRASWIKSGTHINAVGSCSPAARELDSGLVAGSRLFTDCLESLTHESGDFLIPKREGVIDDSHIRAELGAVLLGTAEGRRSADDITLFKSLGLAMEDLTVANDIYQKIMENHKT